MRIELTLLTLWIASTALFVCTGTATWLDLDVMNGISGLAIRFFLGYCGIIVISQAFSAIGRVRQALNERTVEETESAEFPCDEPTMISAD